MPKNETDTIVRMGLLADPDTPQHIAESLAESLPGELADELSDGREWNVVVEADPVAAGLSEPQEILELTSDKRAEHGWDYAICVTDLPVRTQHGPLLAEADTDQGVAIISVPALGGFQPQRRVRQVIRQLLDEMHAEREERPAPGEDSSSGALRYGLGSSLTRLLAPISRREFAGGTGALDVQYTSTRTRGRIRLLIGMVRTNRPWRLVFGLSRALAAAVATSAFGLSSSTIWMLGDQLGPVNKIAAVVVAIVALVGWLIAAHDLWETKGQGVDRDLARLYNASTLLTLTIGTVVLYTTLFLVNLALAGLLVPSSLLSSTVESQAGPGSYVALAWAFTVLGSIAGALGSSLETDHAVRQAAYGYRESKRRAEHKSESRRREREHSG